MIKETSAGIIVYTGEPEIKYLILHYEENHWDFPKGHVEGNETHEQTALRETKEETGLDVWVIPGFCEQIHYYFNWKGETRFKTVHFFLGKAESDKVTLSHEHIGFAWLSYDNALKKLTFENSREILRKAHQHLHSLLQ